MADITCGGGAAVRESSIKMKKSYEEKYGRIPFDVFDFLRANCGIDVALRVYCFSERGKGYYYICHRRAP